MKNLLAKAATVLPLTLLAAPALAQTATSTPNTGGGAGAIYNSTLLLVSALAFIVGAFFLAKRENA